MQHRALVLIGVVAVAVGVPLLGAWLLPKACAPGAYAEPNRSSWDYAGDTPLWAGVVMAGLLGAGFSLAVLGGRKLAFAAVISLALCTFVGVMWVRSYSRGEEFSVSWSAAGPAPPGMPAMVGSGGADGHVTAASPDGTCEIDLGLEDGVGVGMTFKVYDAREHAAGVRSAGKGVVQIVGIGPGRKSQCLSSPAWVMRRGDVLDNLAYDRDRRLRVLLLGHFDYAPDGVPTPGDENLITHLVVQNVGAFPRGIEDANLVVLGERLKVPVLREEELRHPVGQALVAIFAGAAAEYDADLAKARARRIPILDRGQFIEASGGMDRWQTFAAARAWPASAVAVHNVAAESRSGALSLTMRRQPTRWGMSPRFLASWNQSAPSDPPRFPPTAGGPGTLSARLARLGVSAGRSFQTKWVQDGRVGPPSAAIVQSLSVPYVTVPYWAIASILCFPPLIWLARAMRPFLARREGHCRGCGYDLRASPRRCPECGRDVLPARRRGRAA